VASRSGDFVYNRGGDSYRVKYDFGGANEIAAGNGWLQQCVCVTYVGAALAGAEKVLAKMGVRFSILLGA
jgi:hypothetical protein